MALQCCPSKFHTNRTVLETKVMISYDGVILKRLRFKGEPDVPEIHPSAVGLAPPEEPQPACVLLFSFALYGFCKLDGLRGLTLYAYLTWTVLPLTRPRKRQVQKCPLCMTTVPRRRSALNRRLRPSSRSACALPQLRHTATKLTYVQLHSRRRTHLGQRQGLTAMLSLLFHLVEIQ